MPEHVPVIRYVPKILGRDGRLKLEMKLASLLFAALLMSLSTDLMSAQNAANRVAILTDLAIPADRIDEAKAEEARQRAEARLREKLSDEQVASVNASLTRSLAQLRVKRRRHV